jgi:hypothetical protein
MILARRAFLTGLVAAPVIVRAGLIMPIKPLIEPADFDTATMKFTAVERPLRWAYVYGFDQLGKRIFEKIDMDKLGLGEPIQGYENKTKFKFVSSISCTS